MENLHHVPLLIQSLSWQIPEKFVPKKFSMTTKVPDTKGCSKCCVGRNPYNGYKVGKKRHLFIISPFSQKGLIFLGTFCRNFFCVHYLQIHASSISVFMEIVHSFGWLERTDFCDSKRKRMIGRYHLVGNSFVVFRWVTIFLYLRYFRCLPWVDTENVTGTSNVFFIKKFYSYHTYPSCLQYC
jgi:hypothetical protein